MFCFHILLLFVRRCEMSVWIISLFLFWWHGLLRKSNQSKDIEFLKGNAFNCRGHPYMFLNYLSFSMFWVLRPPNTGRNSHFQCFLGKKALKKQEICSKILQKTYWGLLFLDIYIGIENLRSKQIVWPYPLHNGERT